MRTAFFITVSILAFAWLLIWFGERLLESRFTVGSYVYRMPPTGASAPGEGAIWAGILQALEHCKVETNAWVASNPPDLLNASSNFPIGTATGVDLSNQVRKSTLYVRVKPLPGRKAIEYRITRPK